MKVKTNWIQGAALNYAVAMCEGVLNESPSRCIDCRHFEERAIQDGAQLRCWLGDLCWESGGWSDDPFGDEISEWQGVHQKCPLRLGTKTEAYSTDWALGGPIIERELIAVDYSDGDASENGKPFWCAASYYGSERPHAADTPLEAAMRCYVASKLGDEVEIPEELL